MIRPRVIAAAVLLAAAPAAAPLAPGLLAPAPLAAQQTAGDPTRLIPLPQSSLVFARDGSLIGEIGREWRTDVAIETLPRYLPAAFVAVEDQRFYQHDGVDLIGVAGAIKGKILGEARGGASTITQQLIGNMHPALIDRRDLSLERKVREQRAARDMEKRYSKQQILEAYLNTISFGRGWFGIEAAARHYFGKPAAKLTLAEAASLAALPKSPVQHDPTRFPERNRERRDLVLTLMEQQGLVTRAMAAEARRTPVTTAPHAGMSAPSPYFVDAVKQELDRLRIPVAGGGLRVHTTLDPVLQRGAVEALEQGIKAVEARPGYRHPTGASAGEGGAVLQGSVVVLDPATGDVRALVGGRNHVLAPFNRATVALRQPGSAFKPLVYAAAVQAGIAANRIVPDTALALEQHNGEIYSPDNADNQFLGDMTVRHALALSRNPVAVQLALHASMDSVAALARRAGIATPVALFPSSALGASVVRPLDFVAAYSVFANLGEAVEPRLLVRVEDASGRTLHAPGPPRVTPALDPRVAFIVRDMLQDAASRGTGAPARRLVPASVPVAGKTGTTNDNRDVWFVGMTPDLIAGVWLGFDVPRTIMPGAAGGTLAAPIWGQLVGRWYAGRTPGQWTMPGGLTSVELDRETGYIADEFTPANQRYVEYFIPGTEPDALRAVPWRLQQWGALPLAVGIR
ncbi:MAG: PBP1A family penicillin-binding protein [Gemmatimonadaceae bacterium]|nr:PBP1A family penicillin-binding protein [Gemmatimonadaceae bacterium]